MQILYQTKEDQIIDEVHVEHTVYGIEIRQDNIQIRVIPNIFCDKAEADALVALCNQLELCPTQIDDVIADAIASV